MRHLTAIRIALIALTASLAFSFLLFPLLVESQRANIDPDRFGELAFSISQGNGFVYEKEGAAVLERTPLYSYVVAALFMLAGGFSLPAVQIMQALIHAVSSMLVYLVALRVAEKRTALLAQLLFALHPIPLWYTARIWVESLNAGLLLLVVLSSMYMFEKCSIKRSAIAGVCIGICCLTKSTLLLFPFVLLAMSIYRFGLQGVKQGAVVVFTALIIFLPWTLRNFQVSHKFLPVNTSLGFNLIQGDVIGEHWPSAEFTILDYWRVASARTDSLLGIRNAAWQSIEGDRRLTDTALSNYIRNPLSFVRRSAANVFTFWYLSESGLKSFFFGVLQFSLLLLGLFSYWRLNGDIRFKLFPLTAVFVYYVLVHTCIVGWGRYSMPLIPLLLIVASSGIHRTIIHRNA